MDVKHTSIRRIAAHALPAIVAVILPGSAVNAAEPAWPSAPYNYVVVDQDLRTVLTQFGANIGVRVALTEAVQGRVRGRLPVLPPRQFLEHLAQVYGFDWFFDGSALSVSAAAETETRFMPLQGVGVGALEAGLRSTNIYDPRFSLRAGPAANVALVSGPPAYVKLVQETATALAAHPAASKPAAVAAAATLSVFRGTTATKVEFP